MIPAIALKFANKIYQSTFALPNSEILNQYDALPPVTNKWHFGHLHGVQKTTLTIIFFFLVIIDL
jgi:hypothetical protein